MLFEIINPSDPYTLETDSYAAAVAAVCILGEGKYGLDPIDCDVPKVPLALFGDLPPHVYQAAGVKDFDELAARLNSDAAFNEATAAALDSVRIGTERERTADKASHDDRRSSLNDIGGRAWAYAEALRGKRTFAGVDAANPAV